MTGNLINANAYNFINSELKKANDVNILYNSLILNVILSLKPELEQHIHYASAGTCKLTSGSECTSEHEAASTSKLTF